MRAWSTILISPFPSSSVKTLLQERAMVRCVETGEEKPVGAIQGEYCIGSMSYSYAINLSGQSSVLHTEDVLESAIEDIIGIYLLECVNMIEC